MTDTATSQSMITINTISDLLAYRQSLPATTKVGFVPTMGFLHRGHMSLVDSSTSENDKTIVSIYVNPTQFGQGEDFQSYPRDTSADLALLAQYNVDAVFIPQTEEIYPASFCTWVEVSELSNKYCGASRPGHFRGVATIVCKLLNLVNPHFMYLGVKDYQQCLILKQMCKDLHLLTEIKPCPIIREPDGLALSSRNTYLDSDQRARATCLYQSLKFAKELVGSGVTDTITLRESMRHYLESKQAQVDYIVFIDEQTANEQKIVTQTTRALLAVKIGSTRLIDNMKMS